MGKRRMGECCLCGTHALLEGEDVYPMWARAQVKGKLAEPPVNGQWPVKLLIKTCEGCNRGLGNEFEKPVSEILKRALLFGEPDTLTPDEAGLVAGWSYLKDIEQFLGKPEVWTTSGPQPHSEESTARWRSELAALRATGRAPDGYVVRLALLGSPTVLVPYEPISPVGWRPKEDASFKGMFEVGLIVVESLLVGPKDAADFVRLTRNDPRAVALWPQSGAPVTVGTSRVPLNHAKLWKDGQRFHPNSGWGGGWKIRVPRGT